MGFKCCDYLLNEIVFAQKNLIPCCCSPTHNYSSVFIKNLNGENFDTDLYFEQRGKYISMLKNGIVPEPCIGCYRLKEKDWEEALNITRIIITNRTKCSCNCVYCSLVKFGGQTKKELNNAETYNIIPLLKDLHKKNLIKPETLITVAGGECSEYPNGELEFIVYLAFICNCRLELLSSGLFYSKGIAQALKSPKTMLKISADSGFKSTFEKIKRVKRYEAFWRNIKAYAQASCENSQVRLKYIIIPDINDNIDEVNAFVNKCKQAECKFVELSVEYEWFNANKDKPVPENIKQIYKCLKSSDLILSFESDEVENWLE